MRWVTRRGIHVNRTATAWLIRRFLDPDGEILFVEPEDVAAVQGREDALGFALPGDDPALRRLARIVHGADFPGGPGPDPEALGLWAISQGFTDVGRDDPDIEARASFLYDSLYAHLQRAEGVGASGSNHA